MGKQRSSAKVIKVALIKQRNDDKVTKKVTLRKQKSGHQNMGEKEELSLLDLLGWIVVNICVGLDLLCLVLLS